MNEAAKDTPVEIMVVGGEEFLFYKSFPVDVALLRATFADEDGNVSLAEEAANLDIQAARSRRAIPAARSSSRCASA